MENKKPKHYIIHADKPFTGSTVSITYVDEQNVERVLYSSSLYNNDKGDLTVAEYFELMEKERGYKLKCVTGEKVDELTQEYQASLCTKLIEIHKNDYYEALESLPPRRWGTIENSGGASGFYVPEHIYGPLVNWYFSKNGKYYTAIQPCNIGNDKLALLVNLEESEAA